MAVGAAEIRRGRILASLDDAAADGAGAGELLVQRLAVPPPDEYAPHAQGGFPTASGKVEFLASAAAGGNFVVPLFRQGSNDHQPGQPVDPLPHYIPPRENAQGDPSLAARFPLNLLTPKSHA